MDGLVEQRGLLMGWLITFGAPEPEDGAQNIMLRAWRKTDTRPKLPAYWRTVAYNEAADQFRRRDCRTRLALPYIADYLQPEAPPLILGGDPRLNILDAADKEWLLNYYSDRGHGCRDRVKAHRLIKAARARLDTPAAV